MDLFRLRNTEKKRRFLHTYGIKYLINNGDIVFNANHLSYFVDYKILDYIIDKDLNKFTYPVQEILFCLINGNLRLLRTDLNVYRLLVLILCQRGVQYFYHIIKEICCNPWSEDNQFLFNIIMEKDDLVNVIIFRSGRLINESNLILNCIRYNNEEFGVKLVQCGIQFDNFTGVIYNAVTKNYFDLASLILNKYPERIEYVLIHKIISRCIENINGDKKNDILNQFKFVIKHININQIDKGGKLFSLLLESNEMLLITIFIKKVNIKPYNEVIKRYESNPEIMALII
jgi:hypothetical protein